MKIKRTNNVLKTRMSEELAKHTENPFTCGTDSEVSVTARGGRVQPQPAAIQLPSLQNCDNFKRKRRRRAQRPQRCARTTASRFQKASKPPCAPRNATRNKQTNNSCPDTSSGAAAARAERRAAAWGKREKHNHEICFLRLRLGGHRRCHRHHHPLHQLRIIF